MAGKWEGFTEDEIKFYLPDQNDQDIHDKNKTEIRQNKGKVTAIGAGKKRNYPSNKLSNNSHDKQEKFIVPEEALLLKPVSKVDETATLKNDTESGITDNILYNNEPAMTDPPVSAHDKLGEDSLDDFHFRQKMLEEQNRQKKEYLAKILLDRKKQTNLEAARLHNIQQELHKLDVLLSDDVSILRDEIEVASKEFGEAQKRFSRAEKEFLDAKQSLFAKMERKELLTKHLCTIIEQNELRKAQKLSELMNKIGINGPDPTESLPTPPTSPSKPPLSAKQANDNVGFENDTAVSKKEES